MAGDWIKVEKELHDKPEVRRMARALRLSRFDIVGRLVSVWSWADTHSLTGSGMDVSEEDIDDIADLNGFADALRQVGWLTGRAASLEFPNFGRHNGQSAKRRAMESERKRLGRMSYGADADKRPHVMRTKCGQNADQRREEKKENYAEENTTVDCSDPPAAPALPASPEMEDQHSEKRTERPLPARFASEAVNCTAGARNGLQGESQASTGPFPERERINDVRGMRSADNHADFGASPGAARFLAACLEINPSWGRTLPTPVEQAAALEAYRSAKGRVMPRDMEMLKAYYQSTLTEDSRRKPFWRPDSRRRFWECFGDVITHADRWAKETRWKPASARKKPVPEKPRQPEGPVVDLDTAAEGLREWRKELGLGGDE